MGFWPSDIKTEEILSPREVLAEAGRELEELTSLKASVEDQRLDDRIVLSFVLNNPTFDMTLTLLEVSHATSARYPALIDPPKSDLPEFLKGRRRVPGGAVSSIKDLTRPPRYEDDPWLCATPDELRRKLQSVFARGYVKSRVIGLLAPEKVLVDSPQRGGEVDHAGVQDE